MNPSPTTHEPDPDPGPDPEKGRDRSRPYTRSPGYICRGATCGALFDSPGIHLFLDPGFDCRELVAQVVLENGERLVGQEAFGNEVREGPVAHLVECVAVFDQLSERK